MKLKIVILVALVLLIESMSTDNLNSKNKKRKPKNKPPKKINVTNWEFYHLKQELQEKSLKQILNSLIKFKKLEQCPLGYGNCRDASVKYVLTKIIAAAIEKEKIEAQALQDQNKTLECEALLNRTEQNQTKSPTKSDKLKFGKHFRSSRVRRNRMRKSCLS